MYLSHLFVARDTRVKERQISKETCLLWHHVRGGSPLDSEEDDYEIVIKSKTNDLHASCRDWARQGECQKNPNYMVPNCPVACAPKKAAAAASSKARGEKGPSSSPTVSRRTGARAGGHREL